MGFLVDSQKDGGLGVLGGCVRSLVRRKQVDSAHVKAKSHHQLAKELSVPHLIAIGISSSSLRKLMIIFLLVSFLFCGLAIDCASFIRFPFFGFFMK